jgi:hypothetical protein
MATDIMGLLTGVSKRGIDPMTTRSFRERQLQYGAERARGLQQAVRGMLGGGAPIQEQIQGKLSESILGFDNKPIEEQKRLIRALQLTGQTSLAAQLAQQTNINEQKQEAIEEAKKKATKTATIRKALTDRMGEDAQYSNIKPLVAAGVFDDDFSSLIKILMQPESNKTLGKLYSATTPEGKDIIVAIQSKKGEDDKIVTLGGDSVPKGTTLKSGGTNVAIDLNNEQESALNKELGKARAKSIVDSYEEASKAKIGANTIDEQWNILSSDIGVISGTGAPFKLGLAKLLKTAGIIGGDASDTDQLIANTETYISNAGNLVARVIKEFGAGTGLSDADREFASKIVAGDIALDSESMKRLIKLQAKAVRRQIQEHNKNVAKLSPDNQAALSVSVPDFSWAYDLPETQDGQKLPSDIQNIINTLLNE